MPSKTQAALAWHAIDPDSLSPEATTAYKSVQACFAETRKAKAAFERELLKGRTLPKGKTLKVSFLRGLAVALADEGKARHGSVALVDVLSVLAA